MVNVIGNLEAHWHVLEAEINEINNDIAHLEACVRKYGASYFLSPMEYLKVSPLPVLPAASGLISLAV